MKSIKIFLISIFSTFLFQACTTSEIEFDGQITEPKLVLHSFITPDSVVTAEVSLSKFFLSDTLHYLYITNADVSVYVNGIFNEKMIHLDKGKYRGTYKPLLSDVVKIIVKVPSEMSALTTEGMGEFVRVTAEAPSVREVSAQAAFLKPPEIISIDTTMNLNYILHEVRSNNDTVNIHYNFRVNYKLKFSDDGNVKNYYRVVVKDRSHEFERKYGVIVENILDRWENIDFTDIVAGDNTNPDLVSEINEITGDPVEAIDTYNVFSDELFNGKTYTLQFSSTNVVFNRLNPKYGLYTELGKYYLPSGAIKSEQLITLQSISEDYYYFLKSRGESRKSDYFSEPVQILSNINGGIGYMAGYSSSNTIKFVLE